MIKNTTPYHYFSWKSRTKNYAPQKNTNLQDYHKSSRPCYCYCQWFLAKNSSKRVKLLKEVKKHSGVWSAMTWNTLITLFNVSSFADSQTQYLKDSIYLFLKHSWIYILLQKRVFHTQKSKWLSFWKLALKLYDYNFCDLKKITWI